MKTSIKLTLALFVFVLVLTGIWLSLDSHTKCKLIHGKNICNFYAMMNIVNHNPENSDFEKAMQLCREMENVPKKDSCFEYIAELFSHIDTDKAQQACNEIRGFGGVKNKEDCYKKVNEIQKPNFVTIVSELDTPEKLLAYINENFQWKSYEGHISYLPEEFFYIKKGDCKNLATFGSYVLGQHGYDVKIMCLKLSGKLKGQHAVTVFRDKDGKLKYITNNMKNLELIEVKSLNDILVRESERLGCKITKYGFVPAGSTYVWVDNL
jgi:hypothetical protein